MDQQHRAALFALAMRLRMTPSEVASHLDAATLAEWMKFLDRT
jgi:hypothetical protein